MTNGKGIDKVLERVRQKQSLCRRDRFVRHVARHTVIIHMLCEGTVKGRIFRGWQRIGIH